VDINERFDHLVLDFLYIRNLGMTIKSCFSRIFSIGEQIHDRICEKKILPPQENQCNNQILQINNSI